MKSRWSQAVIFGASMAFFTWICFSPRSRILPGLKFYENDINTTEGSDTVESIYASNVKSPNSAEKYAAIHGHPQTHPLHAGRPQAIPHDPPQIPAPAKGPELGILGQPKSEESKAPEISEDMVAAYVESIFDLRVTRFERMDCPGQFEIGARYDSLRLPDRKGSKIKYFITLDLTRVVHLLPRLLGTIMRTIHFLGTHNCGLSIVEGRSGDGTYPVLAALRPNLDGAGVRYWLAQSDIDPHGEGMERIGALAVLRNMAMAPLLDEPEAFTKDVITVFSNDVAICPDDVLELLHQHIYQNATMTCAMDWVYGGDTFYDSWISRSMSGNTFFEIPQDVSWAFNKNMFWDDPLSKPKYEAFQPFQVYACWGGIAVLDSQPFMDGSIKWRNSTDGECYMGEPTLLSKDLYAKGLGRVMTVPSVNVAYSDADGSRCKRRRGHVSRHVNEKQKYLAGEEDPQTERIEWLPPPGQVKCQPQWNVNYWVPPV